MTKDEFKTGFTLLITAYQYSVSAETSEAYWQELRHLDARDFTTAIPKLIANEVKTPYRPFPKAETIRAYAEDEQHSRRLREAAEAPTTDTVAHAYDRTARGRHPAEQAFGHLCAAMIRTGARTPEHREDRKALIRQYLEDYPDWLRAHKPDQADWLEALLHDRKPRPPRLGPGQPGEARPGARLPESQQRQIAAINERMKGAYDDGCGGAAVYLELKRRREAQRAHA